MSAESPKQSRRTLTSIALVCALIVAALWFRRPLVAWFGGEAPTKIATSAASPVSEDIDHYTCPMHPFVNEKAPGSCPICGMSLVAVTRDQQAQGIVSVDATRRQLIGVRTAIVTESPMRRTFRAFGEVSYDESSQTEVNLKVRGWITKLYVNQTGQHVSRGQALFELYSPELYEAQRDFLLASRALDAGVTIDGLASASRQRLHLLGMSDAQVDGIAKSRIPMENVTFAAPASGVVIEKNVVQGASVEPGMRLYRMAALSKVWVEAEVYEADLVNVHTGQRADVTLDHVDGRTYDAKVAYVYPAIDPKSRTGRVRVELANKDLELHPGMVATVTLSADLGSRIQIPVAALVYTGPRRLVFVDLGQGHFKPLEVRIGMESEGMVEVLSGLHPGDVVVVSGAFLIAAEARISTASKYWENDSTPDASTSVALSPSTYTCPMHPEVQSPTPGKCPKCGMDLVRKSPRDE